jgi:hypothetical protein
VYCPSPSLLSTENVVVFHFLFSRKEGLELLNTPGGSSLRFSSEKLAMSLKTAFVMGFGEHFLGN